MLETEEDHPIIDLCAALDGEPADDADRATVANDLIEKYGADTIEELENSPFPGITLACAVWRFGSEAEQILAAMGESERVRLQ
jgi:hypothetical protein